MGDSMIEDFITEGSNYATSTRTGSTENGIIVAAREGHGTLKRFYRRGDRVTLKPATSNTSRLELAAMQVQVRVP